MNKNLSLPFDVKIKILEWDDCRQFNITIDHAKVDLYLFYKNDEYILTGLYVDPDYRKQGIATKLLNFCDYFMVYKKPTVYIDLKYKWLKEFYEKRGYHTETI